MKVSVDLSLYPLAEEYVPAIIDFIHRLEAYPDIEIVRTALSTQLFGEMGRVLAVIGTELEHSWNEHGRAVLVAKFALGDVRGGGLSNVDAALAWLEAQSPWEWTAVVLALAYLLLALRENLWCWYAAFASTLIYLALFFRVGLLMESALQVYYLAMAVYGWWAWRGGAHREQPLPITRRAWHWHLAALAGVLAASVLSGWLLARYTSAARPWADSFVTWGSLLATWMVARKLLENWLWWLLIDSISLLIYVDRGLYPTALLFLVYLVIVVFGFLKWQRHYREQQHAPSLAAHAG